VFGELLVVSVIRFGHHRALCNCASSASRRFQNHEHNVKVEQYTIDLVFDVRCLITASCELFQFSYTDISADLQKKLAMW